MIPEIQIGLWGPRDSGKTTFLAMLYHECLRREGWSIEPRGDSLGFIKGMHRMLFEEGRFPDPTPIGATKFYEFYVTPPKRGILPGRSSRTFILSFPDAGGEWYERYEVIKAQHSDEANPIQFLAKCHGLLLLVDPNRYSPGRHGRNRLPGADEEDQRLRSYFEMLLDLTSELKQSRSEPGSIEKYAAIVLTKVDMLGNWERRDHPDRFIRDVLTLDELRILESAFPKDHLRYFASSAVGMYQDKDGKMRSNCEESSDREGKQKYQIVSPYEIQPFNVFEPLEWLIEMLSRSLR